MKILMTIRSANDDVSVYHLSNSSFTPLTFGRGNSGLPDWTPDGKKIVFVSERGNSNVIVWIPSDGSGATDIIGTEKQTFNTAKHFNHGRRHHIGSRYFARWKEISRNDVPTSGRRIGDGTTDRCHATNHGRQLVHRAAQEIWGERGSTR